MKPAQIRACHFTFTVFYGIAVIAFIFIPVAFLNFEITFQLSLVICGTATVGGMLFMTSLKESRGASMKRNKKVKLLCALLVACVTAFFSLITPSIILLTECPALSASHSTVAKVHGIGNSITSHNNNTIDVLLRFNVYDTRTNRSEEHALSLKYNLTHKRIEHKTWQQETASWHDAAIRVMEQVQDPISTAQKYSRYYFLEEEAHTALEELRASIASQQSLRIVAQDSNEGHTTIEEDAFDEHRRMRRICRNEQALGVLYICFVVFMLLVNFVAMLWYGCTVPIKPAVLND